MASRRRRDETHAAANGARPPFPLPPGWVYHPRSADASIAELHKLAGMFHHTSEIKVASIFDDDADRDSQDLLFGGEQDVNCGGRDAGE